MGALTRTYVDRYSEIGQSSDRPPLQRLCEIVEDVFEEGRDPRVRGFYLEIFALAAHSDVCNKLISETYAAYLKSCADLIREIDPAVTAHECLARATLIAAQIEGIAFIARPTSRSLPDLNKVLELLKVTAIDIAYGGRRSKAAKTG